MGGAGLHRLTEEQDKRFPNLKDLHIGNGNRNLWDQMFTWSLASACAKLEVLYQAERARRSIEAASRAAAKSMPRGSERRACRLHTGAGSTTSDRRRPGSDAATRLRVQGATEPKTRHPGACWPPV